LLDRRDEFLLLALSLNSVRLFAADRFEVREIDLPGVPKRLTDAVGSDYEENTSQIHTVSPGAGGAIVHGHGGSGREQEKEEAARFCIRVDAGLRRILNELDRGTLPLVVAAAEPLASTYATVSHHPRLLSEMVSGNPEALSPQELQAQGWAILDALLARELEADLERCRELLGTGRASTDPREVVLAAHDGRIDTLFVAEGAHAWGSFDAAQRRVDVEPKPSPESEELLNLAAVSTVRASGAVRLVARESMPEQADAAAVFRY
jgi:hypothetical protein